MASSNLLPFNGRAHDGPATRLSMSPNYCIPDLCRIRAYILIIYDISRI